MHYNRIAVKQDMLNSTTVWEFVVKVKAKINALTRDTVSNIWWLVIMIYNVKLQALGTLIALHTHMNLSLFS